MRRFMDLECIVKRNTKVIGEYNRPSYSLSEVGRYFISLDKAQSTNVVIQGSPQASVSDRYTVYAPTNADIKAKDVLVIKGVSYIASNPMPYRTHLEIAVTHNEEI